MVSRVQSVLSVFSPRKSSKRSRRWERVNTASTPSWTTGARPNTGRFFASNIASDLFPSSFFSSKLLLPSSRVVVCFLFFEMMVEVAFIFVFFSFVRLFVCAQQVDIYDSVIKWGKIRVVFRGVFRDCWNPKWQMHQRGEQKKEHNSFFFTLSKRTS